jgi:chaperonin GroES
MSLQPLRDFLVVTVVKSGETKTPGGILLPGTVEDKIVTGTVVAVGSGHLNTDGTSSPLEVKFGDSILFNKQMSVEVKHAGETFYLMREEHILSVVR